jgi:hypothetical protein
MAKVGIRNAFSLPIYCSEHDSSIFKNIETAPVYYENYLTQLLYSYRVVCAEIRKKEINIEKNTRMLNSHLLRGYLDFTGIEAFIEGSKQGIRDLRIYKKLLEEEINEQKEHFVFQVFKYPIIKVYGSAVFSPLDKKVTNPETLDPLNSIFVHVIPTNNQLYIIVGYHKEYSSVWILNYVKSWYQLDEKTLQLKLTNLFAARIENWGINPSLYSKIHQKSIDALINYWTDNALNISSEQETNFNLFA